MDLQSSTGGSLPGRGTLPWLRRRSAAGERRSSLVEVLVVLCTAFLACSLWVVLNVKLPPFSAANAERSPVWLNLETQIAYGELRIGLEACVIGSRCDTGRLMAQITALRDGLDRMLAPSGGLASKGPGFFADYLSQVDAELGRVVDAAQAAEPPQLDREGLLSLWRSVRSLAAVLIAEFTALEPEMPEGQGEWLPNAGLSEVRALLLLLSAGTFLACIGLTLRQRNNLRREIRALRDAEAETQAATLNLFDSLPVPVLVMTEDQQLIYANRATQTLAASPHGRDEVGLLALAIWKNVRSLEPNTSGAYDFPLLTGDGSVRHLSVAVNSFGSPEDEAKAYVVSDNTLLRDAELRAVTAGKLAVLGELSSAIAHELNQPLAVIKAAAANGKIQAQALPAGTRVVEKFQRIDQQIERARRIIDNVRRLGRPAHSSGQLFSVARALGSTIGLVSQQYKLSNIVLEMDAELPESVLVAGEATLFEIAVLNILLNARDAFAERPVSDSPATVRVSARLKNSSIELTIADNAGGIPAHLLPRIFESFVSSKSAETGTGLGLSIARRAIEGMGGSILAQNSDLGAVFTIHIPASQQAGSQDNSQEVSA